MNKLYRSIDGISDLERVVFVSFGGDHDEFMDSVSRLLNADSVFFHGGPGTVAQILSDQPDILFAGPSDKTRDTDKFALCRELRSSGYKGIIVLLTHDIIYDGGTSSITSAGFDNYLLGVESWDRIVDALNWAILNRKRKNKYIIQFDGNPDAFYTISSEGRVYDINAVALYGSELTPRKVVVDGINIRELETLRCFESHLKPFISLDNVGKTKNFTIEDNDKVFQIKANVHNVTTMGLVATVIKTDITRTIYSRTMDILLNSVTMLSERDNYTAGHSARVFYYVRLITECMGLGKQMQFIRPLYFASLLHDIGKIGVRDDVLLKPGKLNEEEFDALTSHTIKGYSMLQHYEFLQNCLNLVRSHHERPDGKGYPDRLVGDGIPLGATIIAVADGFDAMTSCRPYRNALPYETAISEIEDNLGGQFSTEPARAFLSLITPRLVGEVAELSQKPLTSLSTELLDTFI